MIVGEWASFWALMQMCLGIKCLGIKLLLGLDLVKWFWVFWKGLVARMFVICCCLMRINEFGGSRFLVLSNANSFEFCRLSFEKWLFGFLWDFMVGQGLGY